MFRGAKLRRELKKDRIENTNKKCIWLITFGRNANKSGDCIHCQHSNEQHVSQYQGERERELQPNDNYEQFQVCAKYICHVSRMIPWFMHVMSDFDAILFSLQFTFMLILCTVLLLLCVFPQTTLYSWFNVYYLHLIFFLLVWATCFINMIVQKFIAKSCPLCNTQTKSYELIWTIWGRESEWVNGAIQQTMMTMLMIHELLVSWSCASQAKNKNK